MDILDDMGVSKLFKSENFLKVNYSFNDLLYLQWNTKREV